MTVTVMMDHVSHKDPAGDLCNGAEIEVELEWNPPERGWGADADGNRGVTLPGFFTVLDVPDKCPECGHEFGEDEIDRLGALADEQARQIEPPRQEDLLDV